MILSPLNAIVDVEAAARAGWTAVDLAAAYINGGARFLQLRAKRLPGAAFLDIAARVCECAHAAGAVVVVNDRADIARLAGADGVHVGQEDLTPLEASAIAGSGCVIGLSTHTDLQIESALRQPVAYLAVGPVFGTSTKATGYTAIGLERVRHAASRLRAEAGPHPDALVAIGGVTLDNAAAAIEAGATSVAVITDLLAGGDPEARVRAYLARLGGGGKV